MSLTEDRCVGLMKGIAPSECEYLIELIGCALEGEKAPEKPQDVFWEHIFALSMFHGIDNLAFYSVERLISQPEGELLRKWRQRRDMAAVKSVTQLAERDRIDSVFSKNEIRHLMLKGCLLKEMYPQDDFRSMSDLDILIDEENMDKTVQILKSMGYEFESECDHHIAFCKQPVLNIEIHTRLLPKYFEKGCEYYSDPWAHTAEAAPYCRKLGWNDYYVYMLAHFAKHYYQGGSGIRSVMDIHVFLQKHGAELDRGYICRELEKMGIAAFAETAERLARQWFGGGRPDPETEDMSFYVMTSGNYGTKLRNAQNQIEMLREKNPHFVKTRYFLKRAFLPYSTMKFIYPALKKAPVLLPFFEIYRWINAIIFKRKTVVRQIEAARRTN